MEKKNKNPSGFNWPGVSMPSLLFFYLFVVELIVSNLSAKYVERLLAIIANHLEASPHLEFYLMWVQHLLTVHGPKLNAQVNMPGLLALQKSLHRKYEELSKM